MVHILEIAGSGIALCLSLAFVTDRIASDLFKHRPEAGVVGRDR